MRNLKDEELKKIKAGSAISASFINYVGDLIEILISAGRKLGSSLRRIGSGNICPLE